MYILWLQRKQIVLWILTGLLRGVLNWPVKIFCTYFGHIYIFYDVLFQFFHVMCLNILKFGHRYNFWDRKKFWCTLTDMLFSGSILTIFDWPFYIARDRAPVSARMIPNVWVRSTKHIEYILYKKFLVKPNWVKIRQILRGQYSPPPWTWR